MKHLKVAIVYLLIFNMMFSGYIFAGRRHADVEDIGNRDINGLVALIFPNFVSLEKEIQIGAQYAQYFEQSARLVEDPVVTGYNRPPGPEDRKKFRCQGSFRNKGSGHR